MCYNRGDAGHISTKCTKPTKENAGGKVFALNVEEGPELDNLTTGIPFINNTPLIAIIDTGAMYSFISLGCAKRLNIGMLPMLRGIVIDTLTNGPVTTSLVSVLIILLM